MDIITEIGSMSGADASLGGYAHMITCVGNDGFGTESTHKLHMKEFNSFNPQLSWVLESSTLISFWRSTFE